MEHLAFPLCSLLLRESPGFLEALLGHLSSTARSGVAGRRPPAAARCALQASKSLMSL